MEGLGKRRLALSLLLYIAQGAVAAMLVRCKIPIGQAQLHQPLFFVCTASSFTPLSDRRTAAKNIGFTAAVVGMGVATGGWQMVVVTSSTLTAICSALFSQYLQ